MAGCVGHRHMQLSPGKNLCCYRARRLRIKVCCEVLSVRVRECGGGGGGREENWASVCWLHPFVSILEVKYKPYVVIMP